MTPSRFALHSLAALSLAACTSAPTVMPAGGSQVSVDFLAPDQFKDVGEGRPATARSRDAYLADLRAFIMQEAQHRLQQGQRLDIEVTDVDMAGDFEPWRPRAADVRILRDIYPPRITLRFRLSGSDGALLKEAERRLSDPTYLMTSLPSRADTDPLRYEKALLAAWMQKEFGGQR